MKPRKQTQCPSCKTPLYERIPRCPNCGHSFYELKLAFGWEVMFDLLFSPFPTMDRYARGAYLNYLGVIPILLIVLILVWHLIGPVLLAPVSSLIPFGQLLKDGLIILTGTVLAFGGFFLSLSVGSNLVKHPLTGLQISQILNVALIVAFYGLIVGLLFRIINLQSVTFEGSGSDIITSFLSWFFTISGFIFSLILIYRGISTLTGLSGFQAFKISILLPVIVTTFFIFMIGLFVAGVFWG